MLTMFVKKIIRYLLSSLKPPKHKSAQEDDENMSSEETMVTLFEDIMIVEILARLPPKSLVRFKCVCKAWRSLVSDSKFIQMQISRAIESDSKNLLLGISETDFVPRNKCKFSSWDPGRFYTKRVKYIPQTPIEIYQVGDKFNEAIDIRNPLKPSLDRYHVMGSCNGLICMYSETSLCLLNPATREYKLVWLQKNIYWTCSYGFGYDAADDDYKFVRVVAACSPQNSGGEWDHSIVEIFSIRDCTWSATTSNIPYRVTSKKDACIFLNEALHWVADSKCKRNSSIILSLDLKDKVFREVPHPYDNVSVNKTDGVTLGTLRGKLCMLVGKLCGSEIEIWAMNNYGVSDSWTKLCSMKHTVIPSLRRCQYCFFMSHIRPLHILKNGEILIKDGSSLVLYNPKEKTSRNLEMQGIAACNEIGEIVTYTETIVDLFPCNKELN